jgi:PAT family beta-lactamase induction signal transducer AmpG
LQLTWIEALKAYRRRPVILLFFFGLSAGLPFLLVFSTLTAWLSELAIDKSTIGFFSWIGLTYSIKVFWAPVVDHLPLPLLGRWLGQRRSWIFLAQAGIAGSLFGMSVTDPSQHLAVFAMFGVMVAFCSATQDISIDAYRIEAAEDDLQAAMSAAYVFGYRVALLVGGAGMLYMAEYLSWVLAYQAVSLLAASLLLVTLLAPVPKIQRPGAETVAVATEASSGANRIIRALRRMLLAVVGPFADFILRFRWYALLLLLLVATYRVSDIIMGAMANPFYLELGYTKIQIADVTKVFGFFMTIFGSFLGGLLVNRYGVAKILVIGACMVAVTNLLFAWLSLTDLNVWRLAMVISMDNLSGGLAIVAFIAFLSSLTSQFYTATQYALFSSLMTLPGKFVGGFSGVMVDAVGFTEFFIWAAVMGVPAILFALLWLRLQAGALAAAQTSPDSTPGTGPDPVAGTGADIGRGIGNGRVTVKVGH